MTKDDTPGVVDVVLVAAMVLTEASMGAYACAPPSNLPVDAALISVAESPSYVGFGDSDDATARESVQRQNAQICDALRSFGPSQTPDAANAAPTVDGNVIATCMQIVDAAFSEGMPPDRAVRGIDGDVSLYFFPAAGTATANQRRYAAIVVCETGEILVDTRDDEVGHASVVTWPESLRHRDMVELIQRVYSFAQYGSATT